MCFVEYCPKDSLSYVTQVNHLQCLAHLCGDSVCVLLQMGEEAPLSATFQLVGGGACQIFIAPCLEDEVDGNVEDGHY